MFTYKSQVYKKAETPPSSESFKDRFGFDEWVDLSAADLRKDPALTDQLFSLVSEAYKYLDDGNSTITTPLSLIQNNLILHAIDFDEDPYPDAVVTWKQKSPGDKVNSLGHDGSRPAKNKVVDELGELLDKNNYYAEVSPPLSDAIWKYFPNTTVIENPEVVRAVLNKNITWLGENPKDTSGHLGWYQREIGGKLHTKILVGIPKGGGSKKKAMLASKKTPPLLSRKTLSYTVKNKKLNFKDDSPKSLPEAKDVATLFSQQYPGYNFTVHSPKGKPLDSKTWDKKRKPKKERAKAIMRQRTSNSRSPINKRVFLSVQEKFLQNILPFEVWEEADWKLLASEWEEEVEITSGNAHPHDPPNAKDIETLVGWDGASVFLITVNGLPYNVLVEWWLSVDWETIGLARGLSIDKVEVENENQALPSFEENNEVYSLAEVVESDLVEIVLFQDLLAEDSGKPMFPSIKEEEEEEYQINDYSDYEDDSPRADYIYDPMMR